MNRSKIGANCNDTLTGNELNEIEPMRSNIGNRSQLSAFFS